MPTECRLIEVERRDNSVLDRQTKKQPLPGDMWYDPHRLRGEDASVRLSPHYLKGALTKRDPIVVVLPDGQHWCVDERAYERPEERPPVEAGHAAYKKWADKGWHGDGWTVEGTPPNISVQPSINTERYHGLLTNGVLSDDLGAHLPKQKRTNRKPREK